MTTTPYRPIRGIEVSFNGDAQAGDLDLQDADITQPGIIMRGPGARELAARVHVTGGSEVAITGTPQALFWRPDVVSDELCMVSGDTLYTSKPTEITGNGTQAWKRIGTWAPWLLRQSVLFQTLQNVLDADVATIRTPTGAVFQVLVYEQRLTALGPFGQPGAAGVWVAAFAEDGGVVAPLTLLDANGTMPRVCACDTGVVISWWNAGLNSWRGSTWRLTNPVEFLAVYNIATVPAGQSNGRHDMRKNGAADQVIMVFTDNVGAFVIGLTRITPAGVVSPLANTAAVVPPSQAVAIDVDPLGGYLVTWASGTQASTRHFDNAGTPTTLEVSFTPALPILRVTGCHKEGIAAQGTVAIEQRVSAIGDYRNHTQTLDFDGLALTNVRTQRGAAIWSHAIIYAGRPVAWVKHFPTEQTLPAVVFVDFATWMLVDLRTGDLLARAFPNQGGTDSRATTTVRGYAQPCTPHLDGARLWAAALIAADFNSRFAQDQIGAMYADSTPGPRQPATVPRYVLDAHAGYPVVFAGDEATEADWHVTPAIESAVAGAGGALTAASTYTVAVTYSKIDRWGNTWRSSPALISVPLAAGQQQITLTVQTCRWTARSNVVIEVWRSRANQGGPLFVEDTSGVGKTINNPAVDTVTFVINDADTAVEAGEALDQSSPANILQHGTTQITDHMTYALGRFWSPDPQRPDIIRHTIERDISRDGFGWGWEDTQLVQLDTSVRPQAAGPIQGGMAIFAGNIVHMLNGLGPDKQGAGLFQAPLTTFGVVDLETSQAKIATIPDGAVPGGLVYATPRGLYLLQRDQLSAMLSRQVERLFRFDGVVPQAIAFAPIQGDVFMMTVTPEARSLRFNVLTNRWCADSARRAQDVAVSPRGEVAWLLPDGRVRILDETLFADGDDDLVFRGTTPLIKLGDTVSQPVTVQGLLTHTYLLSGPAVVTFRLQDGRTGDFIPPLADPPFSFTYSQVGPQSIDLQPINMASLGMRVIWEQPAGDTGKIAIVELDVQLEPSSGTMIRTVQSL